MRAGLAQIRDVTDMIAGARPVVVMVGEWEPALGQCIDGFEDRNAVGTAASQVINLTRPGIAVKAQKQLGHVVGVDLIADLFSLVPENCVWLAKYGASHNIVE